MKTAALVGLVVAAAAAAAGLYFVRRPSLGVVRNDAAGPRLPAMPSMPAMPSLPGLADLKGHMPNAPRLSPGMGFGPQANPSLFAGMWG